MVIQTLETKTIHDEQKLQYPTTFSTVMTNRTSFAQSCLDHRFTNKRKERKSDLPNKNKIGELETYKAILPLRPLVAELSGSRCRRIGSGGSGKLSPPLTHDAWTTWRHRKRKISSWGVLCKGREHNEQTLFAACMKKKKKKLNMSWTLLFFFKKKEKRSHVRKNPLVWFFCSILEKSDISPFKIVWHPSNNDICKWKSCNILIKASCNPGISSPFLIRRISRIGLISTPTFSSKPRMKAIFWWCQSARETMTRKIKKLIIVIIELTGSGLWILQQIFPKIIIALFLCEINSTMNVTQSLDNQRQCLLIAPHSTK